MRGIKNEEAANPFKIDTSKFEEKISDMTDSLGTLTEKILSANGLDEDSINVIISVGGGLNISEFSRKIDESF